MDSRSPDLLRLPAGRLEERFEDKKPLFDESEAIAEANRCLYCVDAPCIKACPTAIDIPTFIRKIGTGNVKGAARTILTANLLGESCGQVCPVEVLCAGACVYNEWEREPIKIGRLQHYAVNEALKQKRDLFAPKPETGRKVALVGAGPASIAAAGWLALEGHRSVIFERKSIPGGLNTLGIAPYKMKGQGALDEIAWVLELGQGRIEIRTGVEIVAGEAGAGQISASDLLREYDAVFLGLGLGSDSTLGVPGEEGPGVVGATAFIERLKADTTLTLEGVKRALVVGGGNTALDALHELPLLGVDTAMVYRRSRAEMPGYAHELEGARIDGARMIENRVPIAVLRDGERLVGLRVAPAKDGKRIEGSEEDLPADLIVVAIGQNRATQVAQAFPGVSLDGKGRVVVDKATHRTGNDKVYSGGDCVNGGKEVVNAVAEAKVAVQAMCAAFSEGAK
ncbi:Pyridine nucleotide-disulfide oxidoreductase associated with reductive pyrimidine catabolism [Minicystis rosea]|nr:Pyridine nucleotide-disulfide oxidoreductase associated with reductive pyrimidine catabolism [Minicystis rosea]